MQALHSDLHSNLSKRFYLVDSFKIRVKANVFKGSVYIQERTNYMLLKALLTVWVAANKRKINNNQQ